ncbi:unnamed protein product, partial [Amoebophrya sp. A25]
TVRTTPRSASGASSCSSATSYSLHQSGSCSSNTPFDFGGTLGGDYVAATG